MSKIISWDNVMDQSLKVPGMKINRSEFLNNAFNMYGNTELLKDKRPIDVFDETIIHKVAQDVTTKHLRIASATSTIAGIPGGFAMIGTLPTDLAQYYGHVLVLAQKLGYIYGWPDLLDENKNVTEGTRNVLTLFVGVMFGAQSANKAIVGLGRSFSFQIAKRLPQQALTKTVYYPIIKEIAKWIGLKMTKDVFAKGVGTAIPIIGGVVSGGITYVSFNTMSKKLQKHLHEEMLLCSESKDNFGNSPETEEPDDQNTATEEQNNEVNLELLSIQACINMAKIDFDLDETEIDLITEMIDRSDLAIDEKMNLLEQLRSNELIPIDFEPLKSNDLYAISLIENIAAVMKADSIIKPSEKIYFYKVVNELGFSKEQVSEFIEEPVDLKE